MVQAWSAPGEPPAARGLSFGGAREAASHARACAVAGGVVTVWLLAGALAPLLARFSSAGVALVGIVPPLVVGAALLAAKPHAARVAGGVLVTLGLAAAIGGHAVGPRGADVQSLLPPSFFVAVGLPPVVAAAFVGALLVIVPLWAGARVHGIGVTLDATGATARSIRLDAATMGAREAADLDARVPAPRVVAGALARLAEGYHFAGAMAAVAAAAVVDAVRARSARERVARLHADVTLETLAMALAERGVVADVIDGRLRATVPPTAASDAAPVVRVRLVTLRFPRVAADQLVEIAGEADAVQRFRALVEQDLAHLARFTWSRPARRLEARIDGMAAEARVVGSVEERSILLEEIDTLARVIARRRLSHDEWAILQWKAQRLRARLATSLAGEPTAPKREDRVKTPAAALAPDLAHVMSAGGLSAIERLAFAPHWVVPVESAWGEREIVIDAATARHDAATSAALLDAMATRPPLPFLEVGRRATFATAPTPTASLLRALRETLPSGLRASAASVEAPMECVLVPVLGGAGERVNGVTGAPLDPREPVAAPA